MEPKDNPAVPSCPSISEGNVENQAGAEVGLEPGLSGLEAHSGRGLSSGDEIQVSCENEALPALSSEEMVHGTPVKRRQIGLPRTTVPRKNPSQGKKSPANSRGHTERENTVYQPEDLPSTSHQAGSSQGRQMFCWPSALPTLPYMAVTSDQKLVVSPYMQLHGASALPNPCVNMVLMPCLVTDRHPLMPQVPAEVRVPETWVGPNASDQALVSDTSECQEILEAAEALMTLKNSSSTWRQTHR
ncbi:doublesex- and mab-3-related transcription factor C1-like [Psammomys obesus]|uniref:doublesex- and mab-3-related transcription factor C1-like n=1 Tax=Psammomys obesus TaxID=48139 RepID=UPI002452ECBE|nr:doublesex- and mab-3-related transcription factor C1-like [Psammomys obesus]